MAAVHTAVRFASSAFNTTEPRDYFINECCFGDDLGRWLIGRLRDAGIDVDGEPDQEDFGWFINYRADGERYCFVFGWQPGDASEPGVWRGEVERDCGFLASLLGGRTRGVGEPGVAAIRRALEGAPEIADIRWHARGDAD